METYEPPMFPWGSEWMTMTEILSFGAPLMFCRNSDQVSTGHLFHWAVGDVGGDDDCKYDGGARRGGREVFKDLIIRLVSIRSW